MAALATYLNPQEQKQVSLCDFKAGLLYIVNSSKVYTGRLGFKNQKQVKRKVSVCLHSLALIMKPHAPGVQ